MKTNLLALAGQSQANRKYLQKAKKKEGKTWGSCQDWKSNGVKVAYHQLVGSGDYYIQGVRSGNELQFCLDVKATVSQINYRVLRSLCGD